MNRNQIEHILGYQFNHIDLLYQALRHRSYIHEHPEDGEHNEKLEFLGDAVLELALTHLLLQKNPTLQEGDLSLLRSQLVNEQALSKQAKKLNLGQYLLLGRGEERSNGRNKPSLLANTLEALLGAVYLDSNFETAQSIVQELFKKELCTPLLQQNFKSELQHTLQTLLQERPQYKILSTQGPEHRKEFQIGVFVKDQCIGQGTGFSKQEAEQNAAQIALLQFQKH